MLARRNLLFATFSIALFASLTSLFLNHQNMAKATTSPVLVFSNSSITETTSGSGYSISGTTLSITSSGTYQITGSCSDGAIIIKKGTTGVTLILDSLTLTSVTGNAPITINKNNTDITIKLVGTSYLTDNESDTTSSDYEGAAIKAKSGSSVTFTGSGALYAYGNTKNGIKGGAEADLIFDNGTYHVEAVNNAIASDGTLTVNNGTFDIDADNDGLKSVPDDTDTASNGAIYINGGTFDIDVDGDAISGYSAVTITNGVFDIKTLDGYNSSSCTHSDSTGTTSCKGIKGTNDDAAVVTFSGGTFVINTADDAIHSDGYVTISGGTFEVQTGDDGMHADTSLTIGAENGYERDPEIDILESYEGLEGGTVYVYSGRISVVADDDGINAAGGDSGSGDNFNPGGGPGGPSGTRPGGSASSTSKCSSTVADYAILIYGGNIYVNVEGDGLDANGDVRIYGGNLEIWGMKSGGDNEPIDVDSCLLINDATVFASGSTGMNAVHSSLGSTNQNYIYSTTSYSSSKVINVKTSSSGSVAYSAKAPKNVAYTFFTSPSTTSSYTFTSTSSLTTCKANSWQQTWSENVSSYATSSADGLETYTSGCSITEYKTLKSYATGDIDGNGAINVLDALYVSRYKLSPIEDNWYSPSYPGLEAADYDGSGTVNLIDAIQIARSKISN